MKVVADFSLLWGKVREMGAFRVDFDLKASESRELRIDRALSSSAGLDIDIDKDLEFDHGVLSFQGRQILLFIPDHGSRVAEVLTGQKSGNKYHVADCKTLESMREKKRFDRYKATCNTSGSFKIFGESYETGDSIEGEVDLDVCRNCLSYLNYKGYRNARNKVFGEFDIAAFLSEYSTLFRSMPDRGTLVEKGGYADDWRTVSAKYRDSVGYHCEACGVDLNSDKALLHTHHINGNKRDNRRANLRALCADCHRKQPAHDAMRLKHEDMVRLTDLRRNQGLLNGCDWDDVIKLTDAALSGLLRIYQSKGFPVPEVGFELTGADQSVIAELEVAWPGMKKGIAIGRGDLAASRKLGWHVLSVGEALKAMNK